MLEKNYLITDEYGNYASGSSHYGPRSRFDGLFIWRNGSQTFNLLNRVQEKVVSTTSEMFLSSNLYLDAIHPNGNKNIKIFEFVGKNPTWVYSFGQLIIYKSITLTAGKLKIIYSGTNACSETLKLVITPLLAMRAANTLCEAPPQLILSDNQIKSANFSLRFNSDMLFAFKPDEYKNFYYPADKADGNSFTEQLSTPGDFYAQILPSSDFCFEITFFVEELLPKPLVSDLPKKLLGTRQFEQMPNFLINKVPSYSVIAGYPWFGEWTRDTLISLPGLCLNKPEVQIQILRELAEKMQDGLLPNTDNNYHAIDATLWFAITFWKLFKRYKISPKDTRYFLDKFEEIFIAIQDGKNMLAINPLGFLEDKSPGGRTWMDAQINGKPVTPRAEYAVEIQALWYNFTKCVVDIKRSVNDLTFIQPLSTISSQISHNFAGEFYNRYLADCITDGTVDETIRPNQVIALSLPFEILSKRQAKQALAYVESWLLTDLGMQTLQTKDKNFIAEYSGPQSKRDLAYHNGMIWPFLMWFFAIAYLKAHGFNKKSIEYVNVLIDRFLAQCPDQISEIFEPSSFSPKGATSQAWNYALLIELSDLINSKS